MSLAWTRAFPVVMTGHPSSTALLQYLNVGQALASTPDQLDDGAVGPIGRAAECELDWGSTARQPSAVCGTAGCVAQESRGDLQTDRQINRPVGGRPVALGYSRVWHRGPDIQVTEDRSQRRHPRHRDTAVTGCHQLCSTGTDRQRHQRKITPGRCTPLRPA